MTTASATTEQPERGYVAWGILAYMGVLHAGALLAFVPRYFSWSGVALCFLLHWVTGGLGITLTYHRLLTHRSFTFRPRWLDYVFTAIGCAASEGGPIGWVADHRRHHAHSDEEGDVHSPNEGFGWAHMLWFMTPDVTSRHTPEYLQRWAPDLYRDRGLRFLERWHLLFVILPAVGLYLAGGMSWLVWGFFVRSVFVLHTTWLVNSATHIWGYRTHETRDKSTNLWWVALLTYGEGWHNNHHAFQTSARHGLRWWELDMTYMAIRAMQAVGLVHKVKLPKIAAARPEPSRASAAPIHTRGEEPELAIAAN